MSDIVVRTDKNLFLLYTLLDHYGYMRGERDGHPLRQKTYDHFLFYEGSGLTKESIGHHWNAVAYVLASTGIPEFALNEDQEMDEVTQNKVHFVSHIREHLVDFHAKTDFDNFYTSILSEYEEEVNKVRSFVEPLDLLDFLKKVWETEIDVEAILIPMPLERGGLGLKVGGAIYQVIGPPFQPERLHNVCHEASHPLCKELLRPLAPEILSRNYLMPILTNDNPNWPNSYVSWPIAFEEHFIRAVQAVMINPVLGISTMEGNLRMSEENMGMRFVRIIAEEVQKYQKNKAGTLQDVALRCLKVLDDVYSPADSPKI